jgi:hypothetical protein
LSNLSTILLIQTFFLTSLSGTTQSAEFTKSQNPNCAVQFSGQINPGDFDRFVQYTKPLVLSDNGGPEHGLTVCLNSKGGNLVEALRFAHFFRRESVGTVVGSGQICISACALIFMMGVGWVGETSFLNRKLHVGGRVGFHRPSFKIDSTELMQPSAVVAAYDAAIRSVIELMIISNNRAPSENAEMIPSDLIQLMLEHVDDDIYFIDSIEKAGRWRIELFGFEMPRLLTENHAVQACLNSLRWESREPIEESSITIDGFEIQKLVTTEGATAFSVYKVGEDNGGINCFVSDNGSYLAACGNGEYASTVGNGRCEKENYESRMNEISRISLLDASTKLASLVEESEVSIRTNNNTSKCYVISGEVVIDNEPCEIRRMDQPASRDSKVVVTNFVWPSGRKTVLVNRGLKLEINGLPTEQFDKVGYDRCYHNSHTNNDFCFIE